FRDGGALSLLRAARAELADARRAHRDRLPAGGQDRSAAAQARSYGRGQEAGGGVAARHADIGAAGDREARGLRRPHAPGPRIARRLTHGRAASIAQAAASDLRARIRRARRGRGATDLLAERGRDDQAVAAVRIAARRGLRANLAADANGKYD